MNKKMFASLGLAVLILASAGSAQGPSGAIRGRVLDVQMKPVVGASVLLFGPSVLGYKSYLAGRTGAFQFPFLLPGEYQIRAEFPGYKSKILKGIRVEIGKTVDLTIDLPASETEEDIIVEVRSPAVDVRTPGWTVVMDSALLERFPAGRDIYNILNMAPTSLSEDRPFDRTSSILGGTGLGQVFAMDAGLINDISTGRIITNPNTDVIEQVGFDLAGRRAEANQIEGAYVNIINRTGGNDTHASMIYSTTGNGLTEDIYTADQLKTLGVKAPARYDKSRDFSFNLSGPLWENRAWAFIAFRRLGLDQVNPASPESRMAALGIANSPHYDLQHRETMFFFKLTVQPTAEIRYSGDFHLGHVYEPVYSGSFGDGVAFPATTILDGDNSYTTAHQILYSLGQNTQVEARAIYAYHSVPLYAQSEGDFTYYDAKQKITWGAAPYTDLTTRTRLSAAVALTHYAERLLGAQHQFRFGGEFEQSDAHQDWFRSNPYYVFWRDYAAGDPYYMGDGMGLLRIVPAPASAGQWDIQDSLRRFSAFLQDDITAGRVTLSLGLRFDYSLAYQPVQSRPSLAWNARPFLLNTELVDSNILISSLSDQFHAANSTSPFDLLTAADRNNAEFLSLSPRFGLAVDVFGNGRTALKLSYGRSSEPIYLDKYRTSQIFAPSAIDYLWLDLNGNMVMDLFPDDAYRLLSAPSQDPSYVAFQDLKVPTTEEVSVGIEQEIAADFQIGFRYVQKRTRDIIEDIDSVNGYDPAARDAKGLIWLPLAVTDPGWDGALGTADDKALTVYGLRADRSAPVLVGSNPTGAERRYRAAVFTFEKKMSHNWLLQGSVAWTSFTGNVQADSFSALGRTSQFNSPNTVLSTTAPLAIDRPLQIRVMASYALPWDFTLSAYFQHFSGAPVVRTLERVYFPSSYMGYGTLEPYASVTLETSDDHRGPAYTNLDVRLEKSFALKGTGRVSLILDVFNLLKDSGQNIDLNPGGTIRSDLGRPIYTASTTFAKTLSVFGVRTFRIGAKISF
jgi:hypothetical protein